MCLWHCLNCLQHLQTTYFATQSEVVKAIGHWPWREAHHLNWWSILFTCRRRKLWSARCKCHCNMGNASPTCICESSVPHDWAPSGCCRHRGASYYYYLSCLPQLHTKATKDKGDKCPMLKIEGHWYQTHLQGACYMLQEQVTGFEGFHGSMHSGGRLPESCTCHKQNIIKYLCSCKTLPVQGCTYISRLHMSQNPGTLLWIQNWGEMDVQGWVSGYRIRYYHLMKHPYAVDPTKDTALCENLGENNRENPKF